MSSNYKVDSLFEPQDFKALPSVPFSVEASLVHRLGEESVSDRVLSVIELIKNSYDADATEVIITLKNFRTGESEIIIRDDGSGMDFDQIRDGWLRIATSIKYSSSRSPLLNRRVLGQKGIGRLAIENLSRKSIVTTYPRDATDGYELQFSWDTFVAGKDLDTVKNSQRKFKKPKDVHGTKIHLEKLRHRWSEDDVKRLRNYIRSLTPPTSTPAKFKVVVDTDEFEDLAGTVDSDFLEKAVFKFHYKLFKSGKVEYFIKRYKDKIEPLPKITKLERPFSCGPVELTLYFYYRSKDKMKDAGIKIDDVNTLRNLLDDYGGIKLYRDGIRLSGFGNPDDDWTGLDALARNDPTVIPARDQILGMIEISSTYNPEINDTTTRENVIKNVAFQDLLSIIKDAIGIFTELRGEIERKRQNIKDATKQVKRAKENLTKSSSRGELIDFATQYPSFFYKNLEDETNQCNQKGLPNATLVMSRKMIENLLFDILKEKFRKNIELRFNEGYGRPHNFSTMIENIDKQIADFDSEQKAILYVLIPLLKDFRKNANDNAHKIYEYLDSIDKLEKLKIPDIIQHELDLIRDIKQKSK